MAIPAFAGMTDTGHFAIWRSVVTTATMTLAESYLKADAAVLAHDGKPFDAVSIGNTLVTRASMGDLRARIDGMGSSPPPFSKADRSNFLQALDPMLGRG